MFLLRKTKNDIWGLGKCFLYQKLDIITDAFQRQQVGRPCKSCRGWQNNLMILSLVSFGMRTVPLNA